MNELRRFKVNSSRIACSFLGGRFRGRSTLLLLRSTTAIMISRLSSSLSARGLGGRN